MRSGPARAVSSRRALAFPIIAAASLSACGNTEPERFCGASFCLRGVAPQAVKRVDSPSDFSVYRVATSAGIATIYEGDHPPDVTRSLDDFDTLDDGRLRAFQRIDDDVAVTFVNIRPDQPRYVVVSLRCREGICGMDRIAARFAAR